MGHVNIRQSLRKPDTKPEMQTCCNRLKHQRSGNQQTPNPQNIKLNLKSKIVASNMVACTTITYMSYLCTTIEWWPACFAYGLYQHEPLPVWFPIA